MSDYKSAADKLYRAKYGEILAALLRQSGYQHIDLAEEAVQIAYQRALEKWPAGMPDNPGGWLYTVARNAFYESLRRTRTENQKLELIQGETGPAGSSTLPSDRLDEFKSVPDDLAAMILLCCNPELNPKAQVCLTLKSACGFSVKEIARSLGMQEEATKKIITRAKLKIADDQGVFRDLDTGKISARFPLVLETLYAIFNEGYAASSGDLQLRREVAEDAIRLADIFLQTSFTPRQYLGELYALVALMLFQFARFDARIDESGLPVRLQEQDRARWDQEMISAGFEALKTSQSAGQPSIYHLEARLATQHAVSPSFEQTDWQVILSLYDQLLLLKDTPEVRLSRVVALKYATGWQTALDELEALESEVQAAAAMTVARSFLFHAVRADLLESADRRLEALSEWEKAGKNAPTKADAAYINNKLANLP